MMEPSSPNPSAEDLKRRIMEIFKNITKDCEDERLKTVFHAVEMSYNSLNDCAAVMLKTMTYMGDGDTT